jgi:uncharacterized protein YprB with RNaseH-like and TPR domain
MAAPPAVYLDVETNWHRELTVLGFYSRVTGPVQLIGSEITKRRLMSNLPKAARLYTFNGHAFDLVVIRQQLGVNLRELHDSFDLRWVCRDHGLTGGQKAIETRLGICRSCAAANGKDAIRLWQRYERGHEDALQTLLEYNLEDLKGLRLIHRHLRAKTARR